MTWELKEIKAAYDQGNTGEFSHMLVAYDDFDYENYPIYVPVGQDPKEHRPGNGDQVDECYSYALPWAEQAVERRANHWEMSA